MRKTVLVLFTVQLAFLAGCAGVARTNYAGNQKYADIKSAKQGTDSIGTVEYGDSKSIKISNDSPTLDSDSFKGRYEIVSVHGEQGQYFSIIISAICDCLGIKKWSVEPFSFLLDSAGNVISTGKSVSPTLQFINGTFPDSGDFFVMVVADSTSEGKTVGEITSGMRSLDGAAIIISKTSHPTGIVLVTFQKSKSRK